MKRFGILYKKIVKKRDKTKQFYCVLSRVMWSWPEHSHFMGGGVARNNTALNKAYKECIENVEYISKIGKY